MKDLTKLISIFLLLSILTGVLASCGGGADNESTVDSTSPVSTEQETEPDTTEPDTEVPETKEPETTAEEIPPETEIVIDWPVPSDKYREHTLMKDVFGNEFYADDSISPLEISETLYTLAGDPDFLTDEYIALYDRQYAGRETATYGVIPSRTEWSLWKDNKALEWANTHGIIFMIYDVAPTGAVRIRLNFRWEEYLPDNVANVPYYPDYGSFTRGDILMCLYFCGEEMGIDLTERADLDKYKDSTYLKSGKKGLYSQYYSTFLYNYTLEEEEYVKSLGHVDISELWSWAEACGLIVWSEDEYIDQNKVITRGEFADMVAAFKSHYGV